jgi:hypothetical protein
MVDKFKISDFLFFRSARSILITTFLFIEFSLLSQVQSFQKEYHVENKNVKKYLDSIRVIYRVNNWVDNYDFTKFVISNDYINLQQIFGCDVRLLDIPDESGKSIKSLNFGDTVYIPSFINGKINSALGYRYGFCDNCYDFYYFCITKEGLYGFLYSKNIIETSKSLPHTDYLLMQNGISSALISKDYSKIRVFDTKKINYSYDSKLLAYSKNDRAFINPSIYIYDIANDKQIPIDSGYSPVFLSNSSIIFFTMPNSKVNYESVRLYDIITKKEKLLIQIPDSLTLWMYGPDGSDPGTISINRIDNKDNIQLMLSLKNKYGESSPNVYNLKLSGELVKKE